MLDQEALEKLQNLTNIIQDKLQQLTQEDLEFLIRRGIIDENQALLIYDLFIDKAMSASTHMNYENFYTLQNDFYVAGFIPLVYCLHLSFLLLAFAISMVHKHFTLRISLYFFLLIKILEIVLFYILALYLQRQDCYLFSTLVHIIFDLTIYNLLLDILTFLEFKAEDFEFNIYTESNKINLQGKIVFNITLLCISFISCLQFRSVLVSFFFFWYLGYLVFRLSVLFKDSMPSVFQPFPYCALSLFSVVMFMLTLLFERDIFHPPLYLFFEESHDNETVANLSNSNSTQLEIKADFSLMSFITSLLVF